MINIFCNVIDNFGDAGVCLRLGRDFTNKGYGCTIYCNKIDVINKLLTSEDKNNKALQIKNSDFENKDDNYKNAEIVIFAFSCRVAKEIENKIIQNKSLCINLEYLSAEQWILSCHKVQSLSALKSYFFFQGFQKETGGLIIEDTFKDKIIKRHQNRLFNNSIKEISLFSYFNKAIPSFFKALSKSQYQYKINIFEGLALDNVNKLLKLDLKVEESVQIYSNVTLFAHKLVSQEQYDDILLNSSLNFVRGEDSIVRALLASNPFFWNIYVQDEDAHIIKLKSFLELMKEKIFENNQDPKIEKALEQIIKTMILYNKEDENTFDNFNIDELFASWDKLTLNFSQYLLSLGSFTDNILSFIKEKQIKK